MADPDDTTPAPAEAATEKKPAKEPKPAKQKAAKQKKPAKQKGAIAADALPSVANHPRALAQVARAKAWGGLGGFLLAGVLSWRAGVPASDLMLRAILVGMGGYVLAWAGAVAIWRHLVIAELRAVRVAAARRAARQAQAAAEQAR